MGKLSRLPDTGRKLGPQQGGEQGTGARRLGGPAGGGQVEVWCLEALKEPMCAVCVGSSLPLRPPVRSSAVKPSISGGGRTGFAWREKEGQRRYLSVQRVARTETHRGGVQGLRGPEPELPTSPKFWVICRNPGEGPRFLGAACGVSHWS